MEQKICNMCGRQFDEFDEQQNATIDTYMYYGSKYDGSQLTCRFCCECFDKLIEEYIIPKATIMPLRDE